MQQVEANPHRSGAFLCLGVAMAVLLTGLIYALTLNKREQTQQKQLTNQIEKLLPTQASDTPALINTMPIEQSISPAVKVNTLYQYADAKANPGIVLQVTSNQGYSGDITMLIAINEDDTINGVSIGMHKETPGLGDRIEAQHTDWLFQFNDLSINTLPTIASWRVKKDGGKFDQITGATVTPRAVVNAVGTSALWYIANRATLRQ